MLAVDMYNVYVEFNRYVGCTYTYPLASNRSRLSFLPPPAPVIETGFSQWEAWVNNELLLYQA